MRKEDNNANPQDEFNKNVSKLLQVLGRILKNQKFDSDEMRKALGDVAKDDNINLNVFFTFMPIAPEDMDEIGAEFEEMFEDEYPQHMDEPLTFEITDHDEEFLKKNGISF